MLLILQSRDQETDGLYEAMEKAVARYEVNCVFFDTILYERY